MARVGYLMRPIMKRAEAAFNCGYLIDLCAQRNSQIYAQRDIEYIESQNNDRWLEARLHSRLHSHIQLCSVRADSAISIVSWFRDGQY